MNTAQPYERPGIVRHQMGAMNKFGPALGPRVQTHIDGVAIADLVAKYGSPLFVFSERTLVDRYRELDEAFARRCAAVRLAWSYKTNYLEAICRVFHREGAWAEVVSPVRVRQGRRARACPPDRIHFNGPYKPDDALERAFAGGRSCTSTTSTSSRAIERIAERLGARRAGRDPRQHGDRRRRRRGAASASTWSRARRTRRSTALLGGGDGSHRPALPHRHLRPRPRGLRQGGRASWRASPTSCAQEHGIALSFIDLGGGFASPTR